MPREIPIALQEHRETGLTTTCYLMKIRPRFPGRSAYGVTSLDRDVIYDDGSADGELTYYSAIGTQPASLLSTGDLSIDNSETMGLLPEFDVPISEDDILAGVYDFANFWLYEVNFNDLSMGHDQIRSGTLGRMQVKDGLSFTHELRGLSQQLKQTVCARDSISCRARLGSQPFGTGGGAYEEREYCGIDLSTGYWEEGEVLAAGVEPHYGFTTVDPLIVPSGSDVPNYFNPGMVQWLTGRNTGTEQEIESNGESNIALLFRMPFPPEPGDTFRYRRDCNKQARDEEKGCPSHWGPDWIDHVRAEPDIPIGDAVANAVPGGTTSTPTGGVTEEEA